MPLLPASGDAATLRLPRAAVRAHAATERRRRYAQVVHVGLPGVLEGAVAGHRAVTDHGLG